MANGKFFAGLIITFVAGTAGCKSVSQAPSQPAGAETDHDPDSDHAEPTMHRGAHGAMHHRFDDADEWAKAFDDPKRDAWQKPDAVIAALALPPTARIADIGAGTGYFATRFARVVPQGQVFASDIEPDMVRYLRERADKESLPNLQAIQGTSSDPSLPSTLDVLFMCNTYHHVAERTKYFERAAAYLAEGGRVVIVDFLPDAPDDAPGPPKKHRIPPDVVVSELEAAGYVHERTDAELLPYQYIAVFRAPDRTVR